jgi:hypothetical protein
MINFLSWCTKLGIDSPQERAPVLTAAVKSLSHESVLFFLCGRDYIYNAKDLKWMGIDALFLGRGKPYEINIGGIQLTSLQSGLKGPAGGGVGAKLGAANFNLCTKALESATAALGDVFLRDMVKGVLAAKTGVSAMKPEMVQRTFMDMRNNTRRYWMSDQAAIGL